MGGCGVVIVWVVWYSGLLEVRSFLWRMGVGFVGGCEVWVWGCVYLWLVVEVI
jgi:hypothetical protein